MCANVKRFGRREEAVHVFKRHFEVERAFAAHDFTANELL